MLIRLYDFFGGLIMKRYNRLALLIGFISAIAAVVASVTALCIFFDKKKKDEEELERYLDCSIQ